MSSPKPIQHRIAASTLLSDVEIRTVIAADQVNAAPMGGTWEFEYEPRSPWAADDSDQGVATCD